ncbi:dioxygenase [Liquorilactobacillus aquaticus DSM 21051]|uniref:Probable nitronate monooxygenase n=1 Tax=Liquorilactobacillus aquaticus DSM 21051 TaxID=1423725 RepID=A0A0R2CXT0_9LACO|nr:nitronate monooxygenase [Liquorilactobacillus aquaticus]KRM96448.1 dioxygenase [Liquorilactobacillus aquaticus DSM 21051]
MWYQDIGLKYPIFQGAMSWIATPTLVAAVSNEGGLGILASGGRTASELRDMIRQTKRMTKRPFGVNLVLFEKNASALCKVICEEKVAVVTTGAGTPKSFIEQLKSAQIKIYPVVPTLKIARKMLTLAIDGLIVEGMEAGGHIGTETLLTVLPQVTAITDIPVIAAGGIYDKSSIEAVKCLGAQGGQAGTIFLATEEAEIAPKYKKLIISASNPGTTIKKSNAGFPARVLDLGENNQALSLRDAVTKGDVVKGAFMAGQVADRVKKIEPLKRVFERLI